MFSRQKRSTREVTTRAGTIRRGKKRRTTSLVNNASFNAAVRLAIKNAKPRKYIDTAGNPTPLSNPATFFSLTSIPQGATDSDRIGDHCQWDSIQLRFKAYSSATTNNYDQCFRVIIFIWHPNDAVDVPNTAELFEYHTVSPNDTIHSPLNHDHRPLRKILYDETFCYAVDTADVPHTFWNYPVFQSVFIPMTRMKPQNTNATFDAATSGNNMIYLCLVSSATTAATAGFVDFVARVNFTDT